MITIISGPPRIGKTAFMVFQLNELAFDINRNRAMQRAIAIKNENGFNLTIPEHCVSANFETTFRRVGHKERHGRIIDPAKIGFGAEGRVTHFLLPYETIGIMEAQEHFNSRKFQSFEEWRSNLYEQHGHQHLDFLLDVQRPGLIDVNVRELSKFIEIQSLDVRYDDHLWFKDMAWVIRSFDCFGAFDAYMNSGKRDKGTYIETEVVSKHNILNSYNSWSLEPKFYAGHLGQDFDLKYCQSFGPTLNDYKQYLEDIKVA